MKIICRFKEEKNGSSYILDYFNDELYWVWSSHLIGAGLDRYIKEHKPLIVRLSAHDKIGKMYFYDFSQSKKDPLRLASHIHSAIYIKFEESDLQKGVVS